MLNGFGAVFRYILNVRDSNTFELATMNLIFLSLIYFVMQSNFILAVMLYQTSSSTNQTASFDQSEDISGCLFLFNVLIFYLRMKNYTVI